MKKLSPFALFLTLSGLEMFAFYLVFTTYLVYQVEVVRLSPLQLVLVGTALEVAVFLFEIPTGIVADIYSRRLSVIIAMFIIASGFFVWALWATFPAALIGSALWGFGYTFTSGARNAWLADEIGEDRAAKGYIRATQVGQIGALIATGVSVGLASVDLRLPIYTGAGLFVFLGFFLLLFMPEDGFTPTPREERSTWQHMGHTFREGARTIRHRPSLLTIVIVIFIFGAYSEAFDRLWTAHLLENFTLPPLGPFDPVVWFGVIRAASLLLAIGPAEFLARRLQATNLRSLAWAQIIINTILVAMLATYALAGDFVVALIALLIINPLRSLTVPLEQAWTNRGLEPGVRATVLSMSEQAGALGEISGGPIMGAVGELRGIRAALLGSAIILSPAILMFARSLGRADHVEVRSIPVEAPE